MQSSCSVQCAPFILYHCIRIDSVETLPFQFLLIPILLKNAIIITVRQICFNLFCQLIIFI